ncbi:hypothetical protein [Taklimakanibacter lacteus]
MAKTPAKKKTVDANEVEPDALTRFEKPVHKIAPPRKAKKKPKPLK